MISSRLLFIHDILNYTLLEFGEFELKVWSVVLVAILIVSSLFFLGLVKRGINRAKKIEPAKKYALFALIKYTTLVITFLLMLQILGFNLSLLIAGSAALLVGVGLGLQHLFSDYVSGIILLAGSSLKVDDVIEVNGMVCKVCDINLRTTKVLTRDDKYIIVPNTDLTSNQIINWTHQQIAARFEIGVSVDYSSDVALVMKLMQDAARFHEHVQDKPDVFVRFTDYGESAIHFTVFFWVEDVFRVENIKSDIRIKIFASFRENGVKIPFPQRVIHTA